MTVIEKLLQNYSIGELIVLGILVALSIKGLINFYDWAADRIRKAFHKQSKEEKEKQDILDRLDTQIAATAALAGEIQKVRQEEEALRNKLDVLFESDKDDIRAWITQQHHQFMSLNYIDDYSLDCLERRFKHYQDEGGNSYIEDLMKDLRSLSKRSFCISPMVITTNNKNNEIKGD